MKGLQLLQDHLRRNGWRYFFAIIIMSAANVIQAIYPMVLSAFTDDLKDGLLTRQSVIEFSLMLLAIGIGYGIMYGLGQYSNHKLGRVFEFTVRQRLFRHFAKLSEKYFSKNGVGKLLSLVMNDVTTVRESIANGLNQLITATTLSIAVVVMMMVEQIPFYLIAVCILPLLTIPVLIVKFSPMIRGRSRQVQESLANMTESAEEQIGGIRVTKTFAVEPIVRERFGQTVDDIYEKQVDLVKSAALFQALFPFIGGFSLVIAISFGGYLTMHNVITLGDFVALTLYLKMIITPMQQIGFMINRMQRARASLDRLNHLLDEKPDIVEADDARPLKQEHSQIEIRNLTFSYPEAKRASLTDLAFHVNAGETIGIVGKTGSGKTTLIKLLLRVYDPPRGSVFIGGTDILDISLESLRTQIAYVPQDGFLFSTTIGDNIAFYKRDIDPGMVEQAAKLSELYENINEFPKRFQTRLGERGLTLSGGQRQRASLARGLIKDAPILILDDSVSAVDAVTETNIISNLREVRRGKTTILIAHRISALRHADVILVMDDGNIVERGTHEQLLKQGGRYASLYAIQEEGENYG